MKTTLPLLTAVLLILSAGCKLTPEKATALCPTVQEGARDIALRILESNDNQTTRDALKAAENSLRLAAGNDTLTFGDLATVINSLPIEALQDDDTRMFVRIGTGIIILSFPDAEVDLSDQESAQIVAGCLADGLAAGNPDSP